MDSTKVTAAKPKVGGAIFVAPIGTTLPTDATTALDVAFQELGYASEDGLTNNNTPESDVIKAWGGDTVLTLMTSRDDTFSLTLIEALSVDVLKLIYGDTNVTGTLATGITVKATGQDLTDHSFVIETVLKNGALKRIVIPQAKVSEVGEITYSDS
ncbi:MAG: phage tail protein, partial [Oscillospiraceae bacterium]|nr:phage tail protein [Oscillospiraceae bacterium]